MFYERFIKLCEIKGVTPATAAKEIGLSNSVTTYWKRGSVPKIDTMKKIADYFGISLSLLYGYKESTEPFLKELAQLAPKAEIGPLGEIDLDNISTNYTDTKDRITAALSRLNSKGQQVAVERVEELTKIPDYQK